MPLTEFYPPIAPSPGSTRKPELKILRADFGDGYVQSAADGLNHIRKTFDLRWDTLTQGQADAIEAFLEGKGGTTPFLYRHPHTPSAIKVTCEEWNRTDQAAGLCGFTAVFRQSFNLAS